MLKLTMNEIISLMDIFEIALIYLKNGEVGIARSQIGLSRKKKKYMDSKRRSKLKKMKDKDR